MALYVINLNGPREEKYMEITGGLISKATY